MRKFRHGGQLCCKWENDGFAGYFSDLLLSKGKDCKKASARFGAGAFFCGMEGGKRKKYLPEVVAYIVLSAVREGLEV